MTKEKKEKLKEYNDLFRKASQYGAKIYKAKGWNNYIISFSYKTGMTEERFREEVAKGSTFV